MSRPLGVRISLEWHSEIADWRDELGEIAERLYAAMVRLAPAAVCHAAATC